MSDGQILDFGIWQLLDIILVAVILYQLYRLSRGTVAIRIFGGITAVYVVYQVTEALQMDLLSQLLGQFIGVGVIALIIVFQQELRQFLLLIGHRDLFSKAPRWLRNLLGGDAPKDGFDSQMLAATCEELSRRKLGALIVIRAGSDPSHLATGATPLDASWSKPLLVAVFERASPMHDGAVLLHGERAVWSAGILPVSGRLDLPSGLGTRHRAALGISEQSDALAVVVSEENQAISLAVEGELHRDLNREQLIDHVDRLLNPA
jgi:diadenylate cyclase